jgi:hypothetical protein
LYEVNDVAGSIPLFGDRLNQRFNRDIADASSPVVLLVGDASADVVVQPVTGPARDAVTVGVQCGCVDPVFCDVFLRRMTHHHDLGHLFERHRPRGAGVWRHDEIGAQCKL